MYLFADGYEKVYNLRRYTSPLGRQDTALEVLNVLDILGFATGAGYLVVRLQKIITRGPRRGFKGLKRTPTGPIFDPKDS